MQGSGPLGQSYHNKLQISRVWINASSILLLWPSLSRDSLILFWVTALHHLHGVRRRNRNHKPLACKSCTRSFSNSYAKSDTCRRTLKEKFTQKYMCVLATLPTLRRAVLDRRGVTHCRAFAPRGHVNHVATTMLTPSSSFSSPSHMRIETIKAKNCSRDNV
jgi:hypothetical protein